MRVIAVADAHAHLLALCAGGAPARRKNSASSRSAGVVILKLRAEPMTTCTGCPARSSRLASSVPWKPFDARFVEDRAQQPVAEALRRLRLHDLLARNRRLHHGAFRPALHPLDGVDRRNPGNRRAVTLACSITPAMVSCETNGRTASWISTRSPDSAGSASSTLPTDSWRCSPPSTRCTGFASPARSSDGRKTFHLRLAHGDPDRVHLRGCRQTCEGCE